MHPILASGEYRAAIACYTNGRSYFWTSSLEEAIRQAKRNVRRKGTLCCVFCFDERGVINSQKDWETIRWSDLPGDRVAVTFF